MQELLGVIWDDKKDELDKLMYMEQPLNAMLSHMMNIKNEFSRINSRIF